jgi:hypothetical protein
MSPELLDRERGRQGAVGIDLGKQFVGLLLDGCDRVRACTGWVSEFRATRFFASRRTRASSSMSTTPATRRPFPTVTGRSRQSSAGPVFGNVPDIAL